jgi:hypothetical protein
MTPFSAMDAISPAIERTKVYLFRPFRLGRFLKLALVASFAEGSYSSFNLNFPFPGKSGEHVPVEIPQVHWPSAQMWIAIVAAVVLILLPLSILISYLLIRLRFSYFDCVLYGHDQISPGWRKYHRQALRYLGVSLCIGLAFLAVFGAIALTVWLQYKDVFASLAAGDKDHLKVDLMSLLPAIALGFLILFVLGIIGYVIQAVMTHCVLPRMALEDEPIFHAFGEAWEDMKAEPGQFALFLLMRILLPIAASMIAVMVLIIPGIVLGVIAVVVGVVVKAVVSSTALLIFLAVLAGLVAVPLLFAIGISIGGTIGTFIRNYGLLFYAGLYPELAVRLWPAPPASVQPPGGLNPLPLGG